MDLTTTQAAYFLGVTPGRVRQLVLAGRLKAIKNGRDLFVKKKELDRFERKKHGRPKKVVQD